MFKPFVFGLMMVFASQVSAVGWHQKDKQQHLTVSTGIATLTYGATNSAWASFGACIGVGLAKELYDQQDYGKFSSEDMQANAIGCGIGMVLGYALFGSKNSGFSVRF